MGHQKARFEFIELVKMLVLAHRHNKNDDFLRDPLVDFATVRDPMYKYSKQTQDRFFSHSTFAFLFAWFAAAPRCKAFAEGKFAENSDDRHTTRMSTEVKLLQNEACSSLIMHSNGNSALDDSSKGVQIQGQKESQHMASQLIDYLKNVQ